MDNGNLRRVKYRLADNNDIEQIIKLRIKLLEFYNGEFTELKDDIMLNTRVFLEKHLNIDAFYYVAEIDNEIIATTSLTVQEILPRPNNIRGIIGKIGQVYTVENYRRLGLQKELMSLVIELAKSKLCGKVYLEAVNPCAISLYEQYGFKPVNDKYELKF